LIQSEGDLINFKELIPELDIDPIFPRVTDLKYQEDQHLSFIARTITV